MNDHKIHGRLVRDPEYTPRRNSDSSDRCNFTVAVDRRFGDQTDFFDCVAFGTRAEVINKYFTKGMEIIVWGEGHYNSYTDRNGVKRKAYSIFVENFDFCGSKNDNAGRSDSSTNGQYRQQESADAFRQQEEDIPF